MSIKCRSCGKIGLFTIYEYGEVPLANALLKDVDSIKDEEKHALTLCFCDTCALVQIAENVSPKIMFDEYLYFSSYSDTMVAHAKEIVEKTITLEKLNKKSRIIEIASNDGYLLQHYIKNNIPVLGIEPAKNIAKLAIKNGVDTICDYFTLDLAISLADKDYFADVIHANNVFAHVPDPNDFAAGLKIILKEKGVVVIEAPYVVDLIENLEFDTVYHEHFSYYSLTSLSKIFERVDMSVVDVEHLSIHGGTLRYYISHTGGNVSDKVIEMLAAENKLGVTSIDYYKEFNDRINKLKEDLLNLLNSLKNMGHSIAAYGASAKGSTLLNTFKINSESIDFIVDRSLDKQGYLIPGLHLKICDPKVLNNKRPDYTLLLTWNFADEILKQQHEYRELGGKFIIPVPEVKII